MRQLHILAKLIFRSLLALGLWLSGGCNSVKPSSPVQTGSGAGLSTSHSVPIDVEDGQVWVKVAVNGHPLRLLLDTGATDTLVSPEAAKLVGIGRTKPLRFSGFGDQPVKATYGFASSVVAGTAVANHVPVAIAPIPAPFMSDGFLGLSFLRNFKFRVDYDQKLLSFAPLNDNTGGGDGLCLPLQSTYPSMTVLCELDGIPAKLLVDTGAGQGLILKSSFVDRHRLRERCPKRLNVLTGEGLRGETRGEITRIPKLSLGSYIVTNIFAEFQTETGPSARHNEIAGFIGSDVLRRFNLTFDLNGSRVWIEPNSTYPAESLPPRCVRSGMVCAPQGTSWIVRDVIPSSPADEVGIRVGEHLLEINGVPVQTMRDRGVKHAFQEKPGTRVRLRLGISGSEPREVILTLRDML
ncbi:MAG: aspartyl protease family protein [Verrucomicrobiota bacterium]